MQNPAGALNWANTIKKLSCVKRFSQTELAKTENVLEHTGMVSLIALHMGRALAAEYVDINFAALLTKALLHDVEESLIGDIARPIKYATEEMRSEAKKIEKMTADQIFTDCGIHSFYHYWREAKRDTEGAIVSYVDALSAVIKFHDEIVLRGNKTMVDLMASDIFENLENLLDMAAPEDSRTYAAYWDYQKKLEKEICLYS